MRGLLIGVLLGISIVTAAEEQLSLDWAGTTFQTGRAYDPTMDIGAQTAMVYGIGTDFDARLKSWRDHGYDTAFMTGIAWGDYAAYYGKGDAFRNAEVQTKSDGSLSMHHPGVGYNVPTPSYIDFINTYLDPAIRPGIRGIFLEEPEFWSLSGWSGAFKMAWQKEYGTPWEPPDSSVAAQYKASRLKYEMYYRALDAVTHSIKKRAAERGLSIGCYVPTHSAINYAHWRIVSPESHLLDLPCLDGLIAQVWTGTSGTGVYYQDVLSSRFFEYAYLEFGQMTAMVRPSGKTLWFLADPVEDFPGRTWPQYKEGYEQTVVASLMWPEVSRFEVMPWPERPFMMKFPSDDGHGGVGERTAIPAPYATELLTVINALNNMDQPDVHWDTGTRGIGLIVSDTMMFQRSEPFHSDYGMGGVFGLALPLLKAGVPVEPVQLEYVDQRDALDRYSVLVLTYEGQKPLKKAYNKALAKWVRKGGLLAYIDAGTDGYNAVPAWWNHNGKRSTRPGDDLLKRLHVDTDAASGLHEVGKGYISVVQRNPSDLQHSAEGGQAVRDRVAGLLHAKGRVLDTQRQLVIRRGPYVVVAVMDETPEGDAPYTLPGAYVNLFDAALPVQHDPVLAPGSVGLLRDLTYDADAGPAVLAAACGVKEEVADSGALSFVTRGPVNTQAVVRIRLPKAPVALSADPPVDLSHTWDEDSKTMLLHFSNQAEDVRIHCQWEVGSAPK